MKTLKQFLNKRTLTVDEIAKKHKVSRKTILAQLKKGQKVEREHSDKQNVAKEIALDHLGELPDYYDRLKKVEKK